MMLGRTQWILKQNKPLPLRQLPYHGLPDSPE